MIAELDLSVGLWVTGPFTADDAPVFVSVTDFHVVRARDLPVVWIEGLRLRRAWPTMPGAVGMWLWAQPLRKRSGSVSVWRSEDDLRSFVRWPRHVAIMRRYRDAGELASFSWLAERFDSDEIWGAARRRLAAGT